MFATLLYSSTSKLTARGILRNLSNMYDGLVFIEPCVTLVYSELEAYSQPCQISTIEILFATLCNPSIFRTVVYSVQAIFRIMPNIYQEIFYSKPCVTLTYSEPLVYSELWLILKSKHIENSAEYLRWSILLTTLCNDSRFGAPICSKLSHIQKKCVSATP